jgi:hypothetical protein
VSVVKRNVFIDVSDKQFIILTALPTEGEVKENHRQDHFILFLSCLPVIYHLSTFY